MAFTKAVKSAATIKIALAGPSGSGKTYSALLLAKGFGGKVAMLDTEYRSASLYADMFEFDTWDEVDPSGFPPEYFISVIKAAENAGYTTLIIDSLSHEWIGKGGCLEICATLSSSKYRGNSAMAWKDVTPRHQALIDAIQSAKINIIVTMRSKMETAISKDENGKVKVEKLGLAPQQRDGMEYEFTTIFDIDKDSHIAVPSKDRTRLFSGPILITENTGAMFLKWINSVPQENTANSDSFKKVEKPQEIKPIQTENIQPASNGSGNKARDYVNAVFVKRMKDGEDMDAILKEFADTLKTDQIRHIKDLDDNEVTYVAKSLWSRFRLSV